MLDEIYFRNEGEVNITAASVGISRRRWTAAGENDLASERYQSIMENDRYDIIPIDTDNFICEYFTTLTPNDFSKIERRKIHFEDTIDLKSEIQDVIHKFSNEGRFFYFLTFHKEVTGLITIGNLNCRQVQVYIFQKLCDLERSLSEFINDNLSNGEIRNWIEKKCNPDLDFDKYTAILQSYDDLVKVDLENRITESLFFVDLFKIMTEKKLFKILGFSRLEWEKFGSINIIRNKIAHPTRSLLDKENSINKLSERLRKIDKLLFSLSNRKMQ